MSLPLQPCDLGKYLGEASIPEREFKRLFRSDEQIVIVDIGSCEGEDSIRYSRCFPKARILAFEPLPANVEIIKINLARYGAGNVEVFPIALSDTEGNANFHVSSGKPSNEFAGSDWNYGNKSSSLLPPAANDPLYGWLHFKEDIVVPTRTLSAVCRERSISRISFIHMDVQGAEHLVLKGAEGVLADVTAIWLEVSERALYMGQKLRPQIEEYMRSRGFALALESRREIEGDQLYVNLRRARVWGYLASNALARTAWFAKKILSKLSSMIRS